MKKFVGVDLHKQRIVVCVVNQARQVLTSARFTNAESIKLAAWLKAPAHSTWCSKRPPATSGS
ncbi:MAG: hypothetical protein IPM64_10100 [Phycisphaerales bacterium]|nr:hypothetical protein [Phycisphaerales bacterium]